MTECYICGKRFLKRFANDKNYRIVRGYCHFTGKSRGAAHSVCNLEFNVLHEIPVGFHSDSRFARFIATSLSNLVDNFAVAIHKIQCKDCDCFLE